MTSLEVLARVTGREVPAAVRGQLEQYAELVQRWNKRADLTSARDTTSLREVLWLDALVLSHSRFVPEGAHIVDIGAGAGAPVLPLLMMRPDTSATLVEPRRKRVAFLRTVIGTLPKLPERVAVVETRVDPARPHVEGMPYDVSMSRATFHPDEWLPIGLAVAARTLILTATTPPPEPPHGVRVVAQTAYEMPSTGAPRTATAYLRSHTS